MTERDRGWVRGLIYDRRGTSLGETDGAGRWRWLHCLGRCRNNYRRLLGHFDCGLLRDIGQLDVGRFDLWRIDFGDDRRSREFRDELGWRWRLRLLDHRH